MALDPPGKPEVVDVTKNSASLIWARPKHDGGSKIIGYFVEACKLPGDKWVRCNTTPHQIPLEEYTATGLEENAQYQFRAIAKTAVNISQPSEPSDPVTILAENGKSLLHIITIITLRASMMIMSPNYTTPNKQINKPLNPYLWKRHRINDGTFTL